MESEEQTQYFNLIREILDKNQEKDDRTGVGTCSLFGKQMKFSLRNGSFPLITPKKTKTIAKELLFFISGKTNVQLLKDQQVKIWNEEVSRENLDTLKFKDREVNDMS